MDKGELTEKEIKLNERGNNILISRDLKILNYFLGDLNIHKELNTYGKYLKDDKDLVDFLTDAGTSYLSVKDGTGKIIDTALLKSLFIIILFLFTNI